MRTLLYSCCCLALSISAAHGALIIDDFNDPVQITVPEMENELVITNGVGELNATRSIQITGLQSDPIGYSDVNLTQASTWTTAIEGQTSIGSGPVVSFFTRYDFNEPVDLTEGGRNNAIFIDLLSFDGPGIPGSPSVGVLDGNNTFLSIFSRFQLVEPSPQTLVVPFAAFGVRGSGGGAADFGTIERLSLTMRLINGNTNPVQGWHVEIDSIRVGRMVPEPGTVNLAAIALIAAVWRFRVTHLHGKRRCGGVHSLMRMLWSPTD